MALDKDALLKSIMTSIETYLEEYNEANSSEVVVYTEDATEGSDTTTLVIDGGTQHGTWSLELSPDA